MPLIWVLLLNLGWVPIEIMPPNQSPKYASECTTQY